jgi:hypothetical protein
VEHESLLYGFGDGPGGCVTQAFGNGYGLLLAPVNGDDYSVLSA